MNGLPEKRCANEASILPYDLIFKILLLLPAKALIQLSTVCKTWRKLINSPNFIEDHKSRCETNLTFLKHFTESRPNSLSIDARNNQFMLFDRPPSSKTPKLQIQSMEFNNKKGKLTDFNICGFSDILATCDGLILATNKTGKVIILNPTTRKLLTIKSGTIVPHRDESYGFVYSPESREYKVVHVFRDRSGHMDGEILSLKTMTWRGCKVPSFGLFRNFDHKAVSVSGKLYWLPGTHNINYFVSMDVNEEKFGMKTLPVSSSGMNDRLMESGGLLNFIAHMTVYRIQIWSLKKKENEESWVKRCTINMDYDITGMIPVFTTRNGRGLILKRAKGVVYEYDMEEEEMEQLVVDGGVDFNDKVAFPHMNTLVSWANSGALW